MLPDRVSNPGPLTYESGALPIALRGPARGNAEVTSLLKFKILTSFLMSRVSCFSPCCLSSWVKQNFSIPLKIEQILSHKSERIFQHV